MSTDSGTQDSEPESASAPWCPVKHATRFETPRNVSRGSGSHEGSLRRILNNSLSVPIGIMWALGVDLELLPGPSRDNHTTGQAHSSVPAPEPANVTMAYEAGLRMLDASLDADRRLDVIALAVAGFIVTAVAFLYSVERKAHVPAWLGILLVIALVLALLAALVRKTTFAPEPLVVAQHRSDSPEALRQAFIPNLVQAANYNYYCFEKRRRYLNGALGLVVIGTCLWLITQLV